ncbi:MFS transporter (plasmid) [Fulvitalea axinellae]|uniref:MFS transporter n=1 Tax=Fulvitalea axinellae TaxID=1182444 RepID=A0AAU9DEG4_9BACT|nr:MFS transporter [Fulvitalea axinellae]
MSKNENAGTNVLDAPQTKPNYTVPLIAMIVVFFLFGGITNVNGILQPYLEKVFNLSSFQGSLVTFAFFGGFVVSSPLGSKAISKWGHKMALIIGLLGTALGLAVFFTASLVAESALQAGSEVQSSFYLFLLGLFTVGSSVAILQVAANPYISALGDPGTADSRINMAGTFNSLASVLIPMTLGRLLLDKNVLDAISDPQEKLITMVQSIQSPYIGLIIFTVFVAVIYKFVQLPEIASISSSDDSNEQQESPLKYSHMWMGVLAIFFYVGAEVSIAQYLVKLAETQDMTFLTKFIKQSDLVGTYWGMLLVGRFAGIFIMQKIKTHQGLIWTAGPALVLLAIGLMGISGDLTVIAFVLIGLFNSVMWGAIFPLGIAKMGPLTNKASSYMIMGIFGGAIFPMIQGAAADIVGVHMSYGVLILAYGYLFYYAILGHKVKSHPELKEETEAA